MTAARQERKPAFLVGLAIMALGMGIFAPFGLSGPFGPEPPPTTSWSTRQPASPSAQLWSGCLFYRGEGAIRTAGVRTESGRGGLAFSATRAIVELSKSIPTSMRRALPVMTRSRSVRGIPLSGPSPVNDFISSVASRRALLSLPIRAASSISRSANGPTSPGTWDS